MVIVSACLLGIRCKYNGGHNLNPTFKRRVQKLLDKQEVILLCPEQLGGLACPRPPAEIVGGSGKDVLEGKARVLNKRGEDVTRYFLNGAERVLKCAIAHNVKAAITKARSPSCGCGCIYDGSFTGKTKPGDGVTAALLKEQGIEVITDEKYEDL